MRQRNLTPSREGDRRVVDDWLIYLIEDVVCVRKCATREIVAVNEVKLVAGRVRKATTYVHGRFQSSHWALRVGLGAGDGNVLRLYIVLRAECRLNRRELGLQSSGNGRLITLGRRQHSEVGTNVDGSRVFEGRLR